MYSLSTGKLTKAKLKSAHYTYGVLSSNLGGKPNTQHIVFQSDAIYKKYSHFLYFNNKTPANFEISDI